MVIKYSYSDLLNIVWKLLSNWRLFNILINRITNYYKRVQVTVVVYVVAVGAKKYQNTCTHTLVNNEPCSYVVTINVTSGEREFNIVFVFYKLFSYFTLFIIGFVLFSFIFYFFFFLVSVHAIIMFLYVQYSVQKVLIFMDYMTIINASLCTYAFTTYLIEQYIYIFIYIMKSICKMQIKSLSKYL